MQTILVASSKGGAGKTTLSTQLAGHFAVGGKATVLVDADPQGSSTRWCEKRADMEAAVKLYRALGFVEIAPYYQSPLRALYFECDLQT